MASKDKIFFYENKGDNAKISLEERIQVIKSLFGQYTPSVDILDTCIENAKSNGYSELVTLFNAQRTKGGMFLLCMGDYLSYDNIVKGVKLQKKFAVVLQ